MRLVEKVESLSYKVDKFSNKLFEYIYMVKQHKLQQGKTLLLLGRKFGVIYEFK